MYIYEPTDLNPTYLQSVPLSSLTWIFLNMLFKDSTFEQLFEKISVADVEQVYFVSNPFNLISQELKLAAFADPFGRTIEARPDLAHRIEACFGLSLKGLVQSKTAVSGHAVVGYSYAMMPLANMITMIMSGTVDIGKNFPVCQGYAAATSVLNVIVYTGLLSDTLTVKYSIENVPVSTQQATGSANNGSSVQGDASARPSAFRGSGIILEYDLLPDFYGVLAKAYGNSLVPAVPSMKVTTQNRWV